MFPPVECADDDGLLAVGGDLNPATLYEAYTRGIFPWPAEGLPLLWFAPPLRGILHFENLYLNARLRRSLRSSNFESRQDTDFAAVVAACAEPRSDAKGTWITPAIGRAYERLHQAGAPSFCAHSFETYQEGVLVGGLYGVRIGRYFCGESMFHRAPNASRFALCRLIEFMSELGATWLDIQLMTPHFAALGAREVPRVQFLEMLAQATGVDTQS